MSGTPYGCARSTLSFEHEQRMETASVLQATGCVLKSVSTVGLKLGQLRNFIRQLLRFARFLKLFFVER